MKKLLMNGGFLSSLFSGFGLVKATITGKRDWKLVLLWVSWILSLVAIIAAVNDTERDDPKD